MWSLPLICHQGMTPAQTAKQEMGIRPGTPLLSVEQAGHVVGVVAEEVDHGEEEHERSTKAGRQR